MNIPTRDILLFGGTPSTYQSSVPWFEPAAELGGRLRFVERPGFGTTPAEPRSFERWREKIATLVERERIAEFALIGISGGGPHALVCATLSQCRKLVLVETAGRYEVFSAVPELADFHRELFRRGRAKDRAGVIQLWQTRLELHADDPGAVAEGLGPFADEIILLCEPWSFSLAEIQCAVHAFHGAKDTTSPVAVVADLQQQIRQFRATILPERGHDLGNTVEDRKLILQEALQW